MPNLSFTPNQKHKALCLWLNNKHETHHRQILLVDSAVTDSLEALDIIANAYPRILLVSDTLKKSEKWLQIKPKNYKSALGNETDVLIYDARTAINLDILYATSGMVCAGGLLVLYMAINEGNTLQNGLKMSYAFNSSESIFMQYMLNHLKRSDVAQIGPCRTYLPSSEVAKQVQNFQIEQASKHKDSDNLQLSEEQQTIFIDCINRYKKQNALHTMVQDEFANDEHKSVVLILGERGRGKSTLLGTIAAEIAHNVQAKPSTDKQALLFCAANKQNTLIFETCFHQHLKTSNKTQKKVSMQFFAPDAITELGPKDSIVFIDEMSSIAPLLLKKIVSRFNYVIMTGTSSGYEGSGKGFMLRLLPFLKSEYSSAVYSLNRPFRWLSNDPIEAFFSEIIPQVDMTKTAQANDVVKAQDVEYKFLSKTSLLNDPLVYQQVFSLLNQAHYQSTPNDIVRLVDASDNQLLCACSTINGEITVIGVCSLIIEGGDVLQDIADEISLGQRRVQGHLTAQALALFLLTPELCIKKFIRINRIAVNQHYRRLGIGSELINQSRAFSKSQNADFISTSFGYEASLFEFWHMNKFTLGKLGERIDTASGSPSVIMLLDTGNNDKLISELAQRSKLALAFFNFCRPRLYETFKTLAITQDKQTNYQSCTLDNKIKLFENHKLSFRNIAPFVLAKIYLVKDQDKQHELLRLFNTCFKKGIHKQERLHLEKSIIANVY